MLDDIFDFIQGIREYPVWQPAPASTQDLFSAPMPIGASTLEQVHPVFLQHILPYAVGNTHPAFMGWVHGGGTIVGTLAEMLAAGLNANLGGRDQIPIAVERQVTRWMSELFQYPTSASGLFVTGSSMANLLGMLVARTAKVGTEVRESGLQSLPGRLTVYCSSAAHGCIPRALEAIGVGSNQLRRIAVSSAHQMRLDQLISAIESDLAGGYIPTCVVGTAGSVDTGSIDDLDGLARIANKYKLWFHVDGACGALGMLSPTIAQKLQGIERSDSIALDFHKWAQVPYDAGYLLVRDADLHHDTFAAPAAYLRRESRGMSAGSPWPCDFGLDLSRSFKALKVWFTFMVYGRDQLAAMMDRTCELARYMANSIQSRTELELLAPVALNIVCFRFRCPDADRINGQIVVDVQESGIAAPSSTTLNGQFAIRAAIFNHRTSTTEIDSLIEAVIAHGRKLTS